MKIEHFGCDLEVKFADDGAKLGKFSGYGAIFGNVDSYGDVIDKGAFKETLRSWEGKGKYPPMLLQHGGFFGAADDLLPIGKWTAMEENTKGLKVEGELFALNTERGQYIYEGLKAGSLDGLSIGYKVKNSTLGTKPGEPRRTLKTIDLVELSVVTFPANDRSRVGSVKSIEELVSLSDCENYLRDACGFSRSQSTAFVSRIKSLRLSDSEAANDAFKVNEIARKLLSTIPGV